MTPFFLLDQVSHHYRGQKAPALHDINLTLAAGEQVGLVGASGSGKSTLLRALLALEPVRGGQIFCQGKPLRPAPVARLRRFRRLVQYIPQDPASTLPPNATVFQAIAEPLRLLGCPQEPLAATHRALEQVNLSHDFCHRRTSTLSGGQAQRVAIARAIALQPRFLLADEPVSGLDLPLRQQVTQLLATLAERHGMGLLMVSHDISAVAALCQRVLVMHQGRIVEDQPLAQLLRQPRHPHTRDLLAAIPVLPF